MQSQLHYEPLPEIVTTLQTTYYDSDATVKHLHQAVCSIRPLGKKNGASDVLRVNICWHYQMEQRGLNVVEYEALHRFDAYELPGVPYPPDADKLPMSFTSIQYLARAATLAMNERLAAETNRVFGVTLRFPRLYNLDYINALHHLFTPLED